MDYSEFNHGLTDDYGSDWKAVDQYAYDALTGNNGVIVGSQVKASCLRYVKDRRASKWVFNTARVDAVIKFASLLRHNKGALYGQPIRLLNWMCFYLGNIVGWEHPQTAAKRFSKAFLLVGRGNAKSQLASIMATWTLVTTKDTGQPAVYSAATTAPQAAIVFNDCKSQIETAHPTIRKLFDLKAHSIHSKHNKGIFKYLSSRANNFDGLRSKLAILDECHAVPDTTMLDVLKTSMSATPSPLLMLISTAGTNTLGMCIEQRNYARLVNAGIEDDDSYFGLEYSIDETTDSYDDPSIWVKANPSLNHAVSLDYLKSELKSSRQTQAGINNFKTKYLNLFVNSNESAYLSIDDVQKCKVDRPDGLENYELTIGLDLAQKVDLCALSYVWSLPDGSIYTEHKHYLPRGAIKRSPPLYANIYLEAEKRGELTVIEGESTDFEVIKDEIKHAARTHRLMNVAYDPWCATQLANQLETEGIPMVEVRQSISNLSEPSKLLQAMILDGRFSYSDNRLFEWCCANAAAISDINENMKVIKPSDKPRDKIDSVISSITGLAAATLQESNVSAYELRFRNEAL